MTVSGAGALGVWHGVAEGQEQAVEHWYNCEHHAERIAVPGFLRARRYLNLGPGLRYFSRYDVADVGVLAGPPYLAALDGPSPWSQRMFPHYRDTVRGAFAVQGRRGTADGGVVATLRFPSHPSETGDAFMRDIKPLLDSLAAAHGVLRAEAWLIDGAITSTRTKEKALRTAPDAWPARALVVDGSSAEALRTALAQVVPEQMRGKATVDLMQLVFHAVAGG